LATRVRQDRPVLAPSRGGRCHRGAGRHCPVRRHAAPGRVPGWWLFPVVQLVLLGLLIAQDPSRIDRRSPTLKRPRTALLVVMPAGTRARRHRPGLRHPRRRRGRHRDHPARPGRRHLGRQRDHLQPVVLAGRPGRAGRAGGRRAGPTQLRVPRERHPPSSRRQGGDRPTPTTCTWPTPTPPPSVPPTPSRSGAGPS
jgi:hypothetical protein